MKKLILCLAAAVVSLTAAADEGMWLLPYLQKMNIGDMKAKGCQLTAEDIYSVNHGSLKDAIVIFGNGCTGEVVSPEGLVFTNHHCGYGSIQALSSVEHDYLKDGFWAMSNEEELPAPGLTVTFIRRIIDVTPEVLGNIPSIAKGEERSEMEDKNIEALYEKLRAENPGMTINIQPFFGGNQYFAFVMEVYRDIRLVGTPPTSIGKFGGETDNWMWPRHTGDFSIFRIYAGKDNRPAEYSEENVPYKAEEFLKVSLDGYKADDFTMIMGFPGSTERYMTSYEIDEMFQVSGPQRIDIRGARQDILKEDMAASDKVRIQYASKYANSSNYWKNTIGMLRGLKKLDVKALKEAQEAEFQAWAEQNTLPEEGFVDALGMIREAVNDNMAYTGPLQYLSEAMVRSVEIMTPALVANRMLTAEEVSDEAKAQAKEYYANFYKDYNLPTDRKVARKMLSMVKENVKDLPTVFAEVIDAQFGGDIDAYVDYLYDNSVFTDEAKASAATSEQIKNDPAVVLATSVLNKMKELREKETADEIDRIAKTIEETLNAETNSRVYISSGTIVSDLKDVSRSYKEAKMALEVGKIFETDKYIVNYEKLGIGRLIYQLPLPLCRMFIKEVLHGLTMDDFDDETLATVNKFFENNLNVSETSRQLYIHRNTLVYRLDKLQKMTGLDLRNFDDAIIFKITLMVSKYMIYMDKMAY